MKSTPYDRYKYRSVAGAKVEWRAYWLSTDRFRQLPYRPVHEFLRSEKYATETQNIHTLF